MDEETGQIPILFCYSTVTGAEAAPSNLLVEAGGGEDEAGKEKKIPSIALGLPTIPSGLKYTKTFTYSQQDFDFTLCK